MSEVMAWLPSGPFSGWAGRAVLGLGAGQRPLWTKPQRLLLTGVFFFPSPS